MRLGGRSKPAGMKPVTKGVGVTIEGRELRYAGVSIDVAGGANAPMQHVAQALQDDLACLVTADFSPDDAKLSATFSALPSIC